MAEEEKTSDNDIDWENRVLCSDGNCIGVIGPGGRCKECGLLYEGDLPAATPEETNPVATLPENPPSSGQAENETRETQAASASDAEWENRRLCPDGNCIGVIGPDGKCKECGRPDEP